MSPRVSICIPTRNAEPYLEELLPALDVQRVEGGMDVVVIDSDSSDCTRQLFRRVGAQISRIEVRDFGHARTRNELARQAQGEVLVFLSQDALPIGEDFVTKLTAPILKGEAWGTTARVLPRESDDALVKRTAMAAPEAGEVSGPLGDRGVRFNNVASAIAAKHLEAIPFPEVSFAEDVAWSEAALAAGGRLAFVAEAVVHHAHTYTPAEAYERYRVDAVHHRDQGRRLRTGPIDVLRGLAFELREDWRFVRQNGGWLDLFGAPRLRVAQVFGQWVGSRGPLGPEGSQKGT